MPALKNARHERFAQAYAADRNASKAFREAGGKGNKPNVQGSKWVAKPAIKARIEELRAEQDRKAEFSRDDARKWCERILKANPSDASADSDICETVMTKAGPFTKLCDKMAALDKLARLCGWNEAEKHELQINVSIGGDADG